MNSSFYHFICYVFLSSLTVYRPTLIIFTKININEMWLHNVLVPFITDESTTKGRHDIALQEPRIF